MNWQANWIWNSRLDSPRNEWHCFRKTFEIEEAEIEQAVLSLTADSRYVLYVNGEQVGRGPVRSWTTKQFYDSYDIKRYLKAGTVNTIAALVLHFGVSNFYYVRGRGGLLAQLDYNQSTVVTDDTWLTSKHNGQQSLASRMSCQQAFSEHIDARLWNADWMMPGYDDKQWEPAAVIGPAGTAPWTSLVERDIPFLTEEAIMPSRVSSLRKITSFDFTASLDIRAIMMPDSADHANIIGYTGYIAASIYSDTETNAVIGFMDSRDCMNMISINGRLFTRDQITVHEPEQYIEATLRKGNNLILIDVSGQRVHLGKLQIGIKTDATASLELRGLFEEERLLPNGIYRIGPFHAGVLLDHQPEPLIDHEYPLYKELIHQVKSEADLLSYQEWMSLVDERLISPADVFSLCVYRSTSAQLAVPRQLQRAVIAHSEPAAIPVFEAHDTELVIDFGKEYSGFLQFEIEAEEGAVLDWYGYEYERHDYRQDTFGLDHTLRYISSGGRQFYESPIRRGFRYMALNVRNASEPVKLYQVKAIQSNYPVAETGHFESSDPLLNDIWAIARHTTKLCMEDTFVDCPAYEQVFWVGDSRNEALVNNYLFGETGIIERCLRLVPDSKHETPLYMDQVPSGWSSVIPNWTFFWAIACCEYYEQTGDLDFAKEMYPHIAYTLEHYMLKIDERGLFDVKGWNLLDWSPIDQPNDGVVTHQNMFLVKTLKLAAQMGRLVGESASGGIFDTAAEKLREAINAQLWNDEKRIYIDCIHAGGRRSDIVSMQTQVVALLTGVVTEDRRADIEQYVAEPPQHFVQIGSPFMSFFYYEALSLLNKGQIMLDDIRRNYGNMIKHGATTCWEQYPNFRENRANPNMLSRSHCHAWSAAPAYFLPREVLGVKSAAPGWSVVDVAPQPYDLQWARGSVPHPDGGTIDVDWELDEAGASMHIRIAYPAHIKLNIVVPEGYQATIEEVPLAL